MMKQSSGGNSRLIWVFAKSSAALTASFPLVFLWHGLLMPAAEESD